MIKWSSGMLTYVERASAQVYIWIYEEKCRNLASHYIKPERFVLNEEKCQNLTSHYMKPERFVLNEEKCHNLTSHYIRPERFVPKRLVQKIPEQLVLYWICTNSGLTAMNLWSYDVWHAYSSINSLCQVFICEKSITNLISHCNTSKKVHIKICLYNLYNDLNRVFAKSYECMCKNLDSFASI